MSEWDTLVTWDREQALEAASDAILRRARVLSATDPEVAMALRQMVVELDTRFPSMGWAPGEEGAG